MQPEASELLDPMQTNAEATTGKGGEEYCKTLGLTKCTEQQATACPEWCKDKPRVQVVAPKATASTVNNVNEDMPAWRSGLTTHVDKVHKGATAVKVNADLPAICAELIAKKEAGKKATCNNVARILCEKAQKGFCAALEEEEISMM
jgi:hypothetical protein